METKVNYAIVGTFVIVVTAIFFVILLWLSVGVSQKTYKPYLVYIEESVSGLSLDSPVKYNGVEVGKVKEIHLRHDNPQQVRVLLNIEEGTPISTDTYAELDAQSLTGIAYLELSGGTPGSPPLNALEGQEYPVIQSKPSLMFRVDAAVSRITINANEVAQSIKKLLDKDNLDAIQTILKNLKTVSTEMEKNTQKFDLIVNNTAKASESFPSTLQKIDTAADSFAVMANKLTVLGEESRTTFQNTSVALKNLNDDLIPQVTDMVGDFQAITENLKQLTQQLEQNPSLLIRGRIPPPPGPGE